MNNQTLPPISAESDDIFAQSLFGLNTLNKKQLLELLEKLTTLTAQMELANQRSGRLIKQIEVLTNENAELIAKFQHLQTEHYKLQLKTSKRKV